MFARERSALTIRNIRMSLKNLRVTLQLLLVCGICERGTEMDLTMDLTVMNLAETHAEEEEEEPEEINCIPRTDDKMGSHFVQNQQVFC